MVYCIILGFLLLLAIVANSLFTYRIDKEIFKPANIENTRNRLLKFDDIEMSYRDFIEILKITTKETIIEFDDITRNLLQSKLLLDIDYDEIDGKARVKESYAVVRQKGGRIVPYAAAQGNAASLIFDYRTLDLGWQDVLLN